jgi:membrane-bound lytic murein transglycosylase B
MWQFSRTSRTGVGLALLVALSGCENAPHSPQAAPVASPVVPVRPPATVSPAPVDASFSAWLEGVRAEARRKGVSAETVAAALADVAPNPKVIEQDQRQAEFTRSFRRYLDGAITETRVAKGRALMEKHGALLAKLEKTYGVPARFLVAFWGMESDFGGDIGSYPVVGALATLAFDGRRETLFRDELFKALAILDGGHIALGKMKGSWAGAMGQTQFLPSTFLKFAVDEDGDGHKDIWNNVPDSLGSTANYVKSLGWDGERTWGREVTLPATFDANLASLDIDAKETIKPLKEWAAAGVRRTDGGPLPNVDIAAALILPDGIKGPAFLVYDDYRVILKYNRSSSYAIAVGHLADRLIGAGTLSAPRRPDESIKRDDVLQLQRDLAALGFFKEAPTGFLGAVTRQSVRGFQRANGLTPDGYADARLIAAVRARASG